MWSNSIMVLDPYKAILNALMTDAGKKKSRFRMFDELRRKLKCT